MTDEDWDALDAGVQKKFPGLRAVRHQGDIAGQDATTLAPDSGTPDLEELRVKYLAHEPAGSATAGVDRPRRRRTKAAAADDDAIVTFEDPASDPRDPASRGKALVVSREGEVLGAQG